MEQRKMSKEEEINDSLEVCRDIYLYYERREANGTEGQGASHASLYAAYAANTAKKEPRQSLASQVVPIRQDYLEPEPEEEEKEKPRRKVEQKLERKTEQNIEKKPERKAEKKLEQRAESKAEKKMLSQQNEQKSDLGKNVKQERNIERERKPEKPKRKNWFKLDPEEDLEDEELKDEEIPKEKRERKPSRPEAPEPPEEESDLEALAEEPGKLSSILRNILSLFFCVLIAFAAAKLLNEFIVQPTQVEGISMEDALQNGEHLLMDKLSYRFHDPERFDIVIFPFEEGVYYIKRIIGLPGETVQIREGQVYINGTLLEEDVYGNTLIENPGRAKDEVVLGEEEYFLLGDNRNNSFDSRYEVVGNIQKEQFLGKAFFRLYPFNRIGSLSKEKKQETDKK